MQGARVVLLLSLAVLGLLLCSAAGAAAARRPVVTLSAPERRKLADLDALAAQERKREQSGREKRQRSSQSATGERAAAPVPADKLRAVAALEKAERAQLARETAQNKLVARRVHSSARRAACPGSCSSHGQCNQATGVCACNAGWGGSDCSYSVTALTSGTTLAGQNAASGAWVFYTISTTAGSGLAVSVNQTSASTDCDVYLNRDAIPSFSQYLYKDISTNQNVDINVEDAGTGKWYIGVYGYLATSFSVTATTGSQCPALSDCSGHGTCTGADVCTCDASWTLDDCSAPLHQLTMNREVSDRVEKRNWLFYELQLSASNSLLEFFVHQTTAGDVDMYIKRGAVPKIWDYDYRDVSLGADFNVSIAQPATGSWFVGIYGFAAGSFTLIAKDETSGCASDCSGSTHGTCVSSRCLCNAGYSGSMCETKTEALTLTSPWEKGYVDDNSWNYYHTGSLLASRAVGVFLEQLSTPGQGFIDCDVYIRQGSAPTRFQYDFRDIGIASKFNVSITSPGTAAWYIGVYGYSKCNYQLRIRETTGGCPNSCSGHGTCTSSGECQCSAGWAGSSCNQQVVALTNGAPAVSGAVGPNQWSYFSLKLPTQGSTYFVANVKETASTGDVWLFATKAPDVPTVRQNEYSDQSTNTEYHMIHAELPSSSTDTWIFGVYGSPLISAGSTSSFKIAAWAPPF